MLPVGPEASWKSQIRVPMRAPKTEIRLTNSIERSGGTYGAAETT